MRNLAKELQISVITTKRAYDELEKAGFIYSIVGKGSFVAEQNLEVIREKKLKVIEEQSSWEQELFQMWLLLLDLH